MENFILNFVMSQKIIEQLTNIDGLSANMTTAMPELGLLPGGDIV